MKNKVFFATIIILILGFMHINAVQARMGSALSGGGGGTTIGLFAENSS